MDEDCLESFGPIKRLKSDFVLKKSIEEEKYSEAIKLYRSYIRMVCDLLDSLNLKNDLDYSIALEILIEVGLLSVSKKFKKLSVNEETGKVERPEIELFSHLGMNIVLAEGSCRHFANFHNDVMKKLEKDSRKFCCTLYEEGKKEPPESNHILNTINHNGKRYLIDIFNDANIFSFVDSTRARQICSGEVLLLVYKPFGEIIFDNASIEYIRREMDINERSAALPSISEEEYTSEYKGILDLLKEKKDRLIRFKHSTMDTKNEIEKGLRLTKK